MGCYFQSFRPLPPSYSREFLEYFYSMKELDQDVFKEITADWPLVDRRFFAGDDISNGSDLLGIPSFDPKQNNKKLYLKKEKNAGSVERDEKGYEESDLFLVSFYDLDKEEFKRLLAHPSFQEKVFAHMKMNYRNEIEEQFLVLARV